MYLKKKGPQFYELNSDKHHCHIEKDYVKIKAIYSIGHIAAYYNEAAPLK